MARNAFLCGTIPINMNNTLHVSEIFYSIQGEGVTAGVPAFFIRLAGCNLCCGISQETIKEAKKGLPQKEIDKLKVKGADWVCDSIAVWTKGNIWTYNEIWQELSAWNYEHHKSSVHIIFTGGEPLLHQRQILQFITWIKDIKGFIPIIEVETNGTIQPLDALDEYVSFWNVSPKLSNSGHTKVERVNKKALRWFNKNDKAVFKWVISEIKTLIELRSYYHFLKEEKFILMPSASNKEELKRKSQRVASMAKSWGYRFSSRLQLAIYDQVTGV